MFCHYESETLAKGSELAVYQCRHGLLHLRVNRVTLTLKPEEFRQLGDARLRSPDPAAYLPWCTTRDLGQLIALHPEIRGPA